MMSDDEKLLFKRTPAAAKLLKESKALTREQLRKQWWKDNKPKEITDGSKPN